MQMNYKEIIGKEMREIMKKMVNLKTIVLTGTLTVSLIILGTTNSQAALQANQATHKSPATKKGAAWLTSIRQMETTGQTMGLDEILDGINATSEENGIDVHMMLPTEYGAVAILSASGYGNSGKLRDETDPQKRTTTGNATGVYFTGDRWEIVAYHKNESNKYLSESLNLTRFYNRRSRN